MAARTDIRMNLSSSYCFLTRRNARTTEGFPKASSNFIAPAHVIRDLHQGLHLSCRRCLIFLVCPLCANSVAHCDRAGVHVPVIDVPAFLAGIGRSAAGESGHAASYEQ